MSAHRQLAIHLRVVIDQEFHGDRILVLLHFQGELRVTDRSDLAGNGLRCGCRLHAQRTASIERRGPNRGGEAQQKGSQRDESNTSSHKKSPPGSATGTPSDGKTATNQIKT